MKRTSFRFALALATIAGLMAGNVPAYPAGSCANPRGANDCAYFCPSGSSCRDCCTVLKATAQNECRRQCELAWPT